MHLITFYNRTVLLTLRARLIRLTLMLLSVVIAALVHVKIGSALDIGWSEILTEIFRGTGAGESMLNTVVWDLRLPRALGCVLVGGTLGAVGSAFQAFFRNPLAEPYVVGVSSGAAVGGTLAIILGVGGTFGAMGGTLMAFAGGLISLQLVMSIARYRGMIRTTNLLLSGVVIGSMLSALMTLLLISAGKDTNEVLRWLLGSMDNLFWNQLALMAFTTIAGYLLLYRYSRALNILSVNEDQVQQLGVDPSRLTLVVLVTGTAMTSAAVGSVGVIAFLGLVAPHISRRLLGADLRFSLPGSLLLGGTILLFADLVAQRIVQHAEIPVGAVTAVLGAPSLLLLLRTDRTRFD